MQQIHPVCIAGDCKQARLLLLLVVTGTVSRQLQPSAFCMHIRPRFLQC
jgi:hypothetical protein